MARSLAPAAERAVRRGQEFISAASRLILESGADEFTVQQVAAAAGRTLRSFYQHFPGKDDLLIALIEESQLVMARLLLLHADRFDDPLERIGGALYWAFDARQHTVRNYNAALARFAQRAAITAPERVEAARQPVVAVLAGLIADAMAAGSVEDGDAEALAATLMSLHVSQSHAALLGGDASQPGSRAPELVRFCVLGLGARVASGWEQRFVLSDAEAAEFKRRSERAAAEAVRSRDPE